VVKIKWFLSFFSIARIQPNYKNFFSDFYVWFNWVAKIIIIFKINFISIFNLLLNLAKSFYGSSPLWLHHKIDPQKNPTDFHPPESIPLSFLKEQICMVKLCPGGPE
jgi:hypothetical protein